VGVGVEGEIGVGVGVGYIIGNSNSIIEGNANGNTSFNFIAVHIITL
jgi:hypothetical protein